MKDSNFLPRSPKSVCGQETPIADKWFLWGESNSLHIVLQTIALPVSYKRIKIALFYTRWADTLFGTLDETCTRYLCRDKAMHFLLMLLEYMATLMGDAPTISTLTGWRLCCLSSRSLILFVLLSRFSALPTLHYEEVNTNRKVQKVEESNPWDISAPPQISSLLVSIDGTLYIKYSPQL